MEINTCSAFLAWEIEAIGESMVLMTRHKYCNLSDENGSAKINKKFIAEALIS